VNGRRRYSFCHMWLIFLTDDDWRELANQKVIIVDSTHVVRHDLEQRLHKCGPGVVSYGVTGIVSDVWEFRKKRVEINYTENLLNGAGYDVHVSSPALEYLVTYAPGKVYYPMNERMRDYLIDSGVVPSLEPTGVVLVNRLQDYVPGCYFAPIGKMVTSIPCVDVTVLSKLPYRTVLSCPFMGRDLFKGTRVTSVIDRNLILFFFDKESRSTVEIKSASVNHCTSLSIEFGDFPVPGVFLKKEVKSIVLYVSGRTYKFGLTSKGFISTDKLADVEDPTTEMINLLAPYVPESERQVWKGYRGSRGSWAEFKKASFNKKKR